MRRCEKMELQDQVEPDWSRYYSSLQPVDRFLQLELESSSAKLESDSGHYCSIFTDEEPRLQSCNSYSFALDARIRLEHLKSGYKPGLDRPPCKINCQRDAWDVELKQEESALDLVELIDVEAGVEDEESW